MDIQTIANFISTIGFPIVACGAMFYLVRENDQIHRQEVDKLRETLEENTAVLSRLEAIIKMLDRRNHEETN